MPFRAVRSSTVPARRTSLTRDVNNITDVEAQIAAQSGEGALAGDHKNDTELKSSPGPAIATPYASGPSNEKKKKIVEDEHINSPAPDSSSRLVDNGWEEGWSRMVEHDERMVNDWKEEIEGLLIVAGLFSAVVTAFVIEFYKLLMPDPTDTTVVLLSQILHQMNTSIPLPETAPSLRDRVGPTAAAWILSLWVTSLVFALVVAICGSMIKQWLRDFMDYPVASALVRVRVRQFRLEGLERWGVRHALSGLFLLLPLGVVIFLGGLIVLTWSLQIRIAALFLISFCGTTLAISLLFIVLPSFHPKSPCRSPLSLAVMCTLPALARMFRSVLPKSSPLAAYYISLGEKWKLPSWSGRDIHFSDDTPAMTGISEDEHRPCIDERSLNWMLSKVAASCSVESILLCAVTISPSSVVDAVCQRLGLRLQSVQDRAWSDGFPVDQETSSDILEGLPTVVQRLDDLQYPSGLTREESFGSPLLLQKVTAKVDLFWIATRLLEGLSRSSHLAKQIVLYLDLAERIQISLSSLQGSHITSVTEGLFTVANLCMAQPANLDSAALDKFDKCASNLHHFLKSTTADESASWRLPALVYSILTRMTILALTVNSSPANENARGTVFWNELFINLSDTLSAIPIELSTDITGSRSAFAPMRNVCDSLALISGRWPELCPHSRVSSLLADYISPCPSRADLSVFVTWALAHASRLSLSDTLETARQDTVTEMSAEDALAFSRLVHAILGGFVTISSKAHVKWSDVFMNNLHKLICTRHALFKRQSTAWDKDLLFTLDAQLKRLARAQQPAYSDNPEKLKPTCIESLSTSVQCIIRDI